jgi:galactokinase
MTALETWPDPVMGRRLRGRLTQLTAECQVIIPGVGDALARRDFALVAELVSASQLGAEIELRNQVPETIALVDAARPGGAVAASAFGAGFGGSVWALVPVETADSFVETWRSGYLDRFPERRPRARFFRTRPAPPAVRLEDGRGGPAA